MLLFTRSWNRRIIIPAEGFSLPRREEELVADAAILTGLQGTRYRERFEWDGTCISGSSNGLDWSNGCGMAKEYAADEGFFSLLLFLDIVLTLCSLL
jgi:hypothetical protein